jgi:hypothetical protein
VGEICGTPMERSCPAGEGFFGRPGARPASCLPVRRRCRLRRTYRRSRRAPHPLTNPQGPGALGTSAGRRIGEVLRRCRSRTATEWFHVKPGKVVFGAGALSTSRTLAALGARLTHTRRQALRTRPHRRPSTVACPSGHAPRRKHTRRRWGAGVASATKDAGRVGMVRGASTLGRAHPP